MAETYGFQKDVEGYWIAKDPNATKNYKIDYGDWLVDGDTVVSVVWTVPAGIDKVGEGIEPDGTKIFIKLSNGSVGGNYPITAHITTADGNTDDATFRVVIREQ